MCRTNIDPTALSDCDVYALQTFVKERLAKAVVDRSGHRTEYWSSWQKKIEEIANTRTEEAAT